MVRIPFAFACLMAAALFATSSCRKDNTRSNEFQIEPFYRASCNCYENIQYGENSTWQRLDFYTPGTGNASALIVFAHPNGSTKADIREGVVRDGVLLPSLANGYAVASLSFRHPVIDSAIAAPATDIARAVQFIRHHALAFGIDPEKVVLVGRSRGSLSILNALQADLANPGAQNPAHRQSSRVNGVWAVGAQTSYDFQWIAENMLDPSLWPGYANRGNFGHAIGEVGPDDPPVVLRYTDPPAQLPIENTEEVDFVHSPNFGLFLQEAYVNAGIGERIDFQANVDPALVFDGLMPFVEQVCGN